MRAKRIRRTETPCVTTETIIKSLYTTKNSFRSIQTNEKRKYQQQYMEACLSFCQYGCHICVCNLKWFSSQWCASWLSGVKPACTQAHKRDTTHLHFTDQTSAPAFAHLNPDQIFYFSSSFVKCDSQGYTWWIAPPPSQQPFSNFLVIWCRNLAGFFFSFFFLPS